MRCRFASGEIALNGNQKRPDEDVTMMAIWLVQLLFKFTFHPSPNKFGIVRHQNIRRTSTWERGRQRSHAVQLADEVVRGSNVVQDAPPVALGFGALTCTNRVLDVWEEPSTPVK